MRDYDRAIQDYDQAIRLNPNYALALNNRAAAYRNKKDYERALADYEAAAQIDPKGARHKSMGYTLFFMGRVGQSAEAMERAVKAAPRDMYAILWRYIALARENGTDIASRELGEHAAKLNETRWPTPVVHFFLGKINEKEMYVAAENPDPKKRSEQICEANFYAAQAKLVKKATKEAIPLLRVAEKECPPTFYETHGASAELRRLGY
jgi:lipoprotein NlpI